MTIHEAIAETWSEPKPVRLTVDNFLCLDQAGAFRRYGKTELIGGTIVAINAQFSFHSHVKGELFRRLADACEATLPDHNVWTEISVAVSPHDLPEPDIVIAVFQPRTRAPVPAEAVTVLIEIADTTVRYDLGEKAALYATAGIPEYWIVDLESGLLHQLWQPAPEGYAERRQQPLGTTLKAATAPITVELPPA